MPALNRSRTPAARGQMTIPRRSRADGDVETLRAEFDAKLARKANATTVGGIATSLKATQDDVEEIKAALDPPSD